MTQQAEARRGRNLEVPEPARREPVEDGLEVPQFAGEGVVAERVQVVEVHLAHAGAIEVEGDDGDTGAPRELLAQPGKEPPVLEPLEAVAHHERRVLDRGIARPVVAAQIRPRRREPKRCPAYSPRHDPRHEESSRCRWGSHSMSSRPARRFAYLASVNNRSDSRFR